MKIEDLKEPVWECQEKEKPKQYKSFLKILSYGKVDLKRLHKEECEEYEEQLQEYEEELQEYEKALQKYENNQGTSTSLNKKPNKKSKPKKPTKPQKPYKEMTLQQISSMNKWEYRLKQFLTQDHEELLLDLYLDLKKDLKDIHSKQVEMYKEATTKLWDDLIYGGIPWSQFNQGVQGLKTLYEMLLQQEEKPTSYEKKEVDVGLEADVKTESSTEVRLQRMRDLADRMEGMEYD